MDQVHQTEKCLVFIRWVLWWRVALYLRCVLQMWLSVSMCFWLMPPASAGKLLSVSVFFSRHWLSGNTRGAHKNKWTHPPFPSVLHVFKNTCCAEGRERWTQYPSSPAGRRGWTAAVHGKASPAAGTGWPTGLVASQLKTPTESKHLMVNRLGGIPKIQNQFKVLYIVLTNPPSPCIELPHLLCFPHT